MLKQVYADKLDGRGDTDAWVPGRVGSPLRGHVVATRGGGEGRYVGTTRSGVEWVSYRGAEEFARLCDRFDAREAKAS